MRIDHGQLVMSFVRIRIQFQRFLEYFNGLLVPPFSLGSRNSPKP
jgi:hypothetical protein